MLTEALFVFVYLDELQNYVYASIPKDQRRKWYIFLERLFPLKPLQVIMWNIEKNNIIRYK